MVRLYQNDKTTGAGMMVPRSVEWQISADPVSYVDALRVMEERVGLIYSGTAPELVWLLEHPPLYTAGTSARESDLLLPDRLPVYRTGRGGQFTYHGPGQRVAYVMLDLRRRGADLRAYICNLEKWLILALRDFNISGERREGRVGVWVTRPNGGEDKIAALGVRVRRWISFHGVSLNVSPDLSHYAGIVPCGMHQYGVTSLVDLGCKVTMAQVDQALTTHFSSIFE